METKARRNFIKQAATAAGGTVILPSYIKNLISDSPNERINIAVIGIAGNRERVRGIIRGRGIVHIRSYADIPNVRVKTICDVDERLFPENIKLVEQLYETTPHTEIDFRKIIDDKEIDIVSLATPDHWHGLHTVWACQAGKDVYVEKPVSHNVSEGRKMVEAAEKYNRIVQSGICYRSSIAVKEGIKRIHDGELGQVYMARGITWRYREPIGIFPDSEIPAGVNWDLFLGPAPYRPYNLNRFLYHWHWFWDTGTADMGNNAIYRMDTARWALNQNSHPVSVHCSGGLFGRDPGEQETPNVMDATYVYEDGTFIQNEVRGLPTNPEGINNQGVCFIYGDKGWMSITPDSYQIYSGPRNEPGPAKSDQDFPTEERSNGWKNFIDCVRIRKKEKLDNPIVEGHLSASLCHLGNISYRMGGKQLEFNSEKEQFENNRQADQYLTRIYRKPYSMPEKV